MAITNFFKKKKQKEKPVGKEGEETSFLLPPHFVRELKETKVSSRPFASVRELKETKVSSRPFASVRELKETKVSSRPSASVREGEEAKISSSLSASAREVKKEKTAIPKKERRSTNAETHGIFKAPHVTEKAGDLSEKNQYIFRVFAKANKTEVKKAVEANYGVDVVSVKIVNVSEKKIRLGKIKGIRPGYKKAIVRIKKGQKIEIIHR